MVSKIYSYILVVFIFLGLISCDAMLIMPYQVKNKTRRTLRIEVKDYLIKDCLFSNTTDTILLLPPKASITLGYANGLGFPWDTKKLYRLQQGMYNFKV